MQSSLHDLDLHARELVIVIEGHNVLVWEKHQLHNYDFDVLDLSQFARKCPRN
jgi:hypothetical protein